MNRERFANGFTESFLIPIFVLALVSGFFLSIGTSPRASAQGSFIKENMPDLGQHCQNWCWTAAAANSLWWYANHGYPELLDAPENPGLDNWYVENIYGCPVCGGYRRLLHEIAVDSLYPGVPPQDENIFTPDNTWNKPIVNVSYFYGLQEFINEQGVTLYVHEIVENSFYNQSNIPPENESKVVYGPVTYENYRRELDRGQDILLELNFRHTSPPEDLNHIVTGVGYDDSVSPEGQITVSDPWTTGAPDHNNDYDNRNYENLSIETKTPLTVRYEGELVQVTKMIFVSPETSERPVGGETYQVDFDKLRRSDEEGILSALGIVMAVLAAVLFGSFALYWKKR